MNLDEKKRFAFPSNILLTPFDFFLQLHLKQLSENRVSGWSDTLESKRKSKLRWKQEVLDREEEKRQAIDKKEEAIRNKFREETLQRAKELQYEQNEKVKFLRSQQLYTEVIETRQQQMEEKRDEEARLKGGERMWHEQTIKTVRQAEKKAEDKQKVQKSNSIDTAQAMVRQKLEAEERKSRLQQKRMEEEEAIIRKAQLDNANAEKESMRKKAEARNTAKKEMAHLSLDMKIKQEEQNRSELADEQRRQRDIAHFGFLAKARSDLEVKHFEERQAARKLLSDRASKELEVRAAREVEMFIRDQKAQEGKDRARKEEKARKTLEMEKEVHESRKQQITLKQERLLKEKETDSILANQHKKQGLEELAQEKKKEAERRNRNLSYRKLQEEQIAVTQKKQITEKQTELQEAKKVRFIFIHMPCTKTMVQCLTTLPRKYRLQKLSQKKTTCFENLQ